jgi:hypothetical protein
MAHQRPPRLAQATPRGDPWRERVGAVGQAPTAFGSMPYGMEIFALPWEFFAFNMNLVIDLIVAIRYIMHIPAHRGASPETILKAERGVASRGCGS